MKKYIPLLLIGIIAVVLVSGCIKNVSESFECPSFKGLNITFSNFLLYDYGDEFEIEPASIIGPLCWKGKEKGENVNYFYCKIKIVQKKINEEGNVLDSLKRDIIMVFDEDENYYKTICS